MNKFVMMIGSLLVSGAVYADCTSESIPAGRTNNIISYHDCDVGISGASQQIGDTIHHEWEDGSSATSRTVDGITYHTFTPGPRTDPNKVLILMYREN